MMRNLRSTASLAGLLSLAASSGCSSSGADGAGRDLYIVACSLACTSGSGGEQVSCSIVNTYRNQELSILFSDPVDLSSINSSSFRVVNPDNGTSPTGQFFLDPFDARRLIFRPSLTFDQNGNPIYGFDPFTTYEINIPGTAQGDSPPFVQSLAGKPNQSRLLCTVFTSQGIIDPVPGPPSVEYFVTRVTSYDQNGIPNGFEQDVQVVNDPVVTDVWRDTDVRFEFNDIMNVATLLNPSSGNATFIRIEVDEDGNLSTLNDRTVHPGVYSFSVDQEALTTTLTYVPTSSFPFVGPTAGKIAVTVPPSVQDLVANGVTVENGGGTRGFVIEEDPIILLPGGGEDFASPALGGAPSREDAQRTNALWGGGRLVPGAGGGAGALGDLCLPAGTRVVLDVEEQSLPLVPGGSPPLGNPDPVRFPDTLGHFPDRCTVLGGAFDFARVELGPGADLGLSGAGELRALSGGDLLQLTRDAATTRPGSVSVATSTWLRPEGSDGPLTFVADAADRELGDPSGLGWNMTVLWQSAPGEPELALPFRGANELFSGSLERQFGSHYGTQEGQPAAPIVVRFQGARLAEGGDPAAPLEVHGLTPWVDHPSLLNDASPRPEVVRFAVLFDGTVDEASGDTPGRILADHVRGVTGLGIKVQNPRREDP